MPDENPTQYEFWTKIIPHGCLDFFESLVWMHPIDLSNQLHRAEFNKFVRSNAKEQLREQGIKARILDVRYALIRL